jgi:hypothetical protein
MGEWQETNKTWYQLQLVYCDLCGKVIPRRLWVVEIDGEQKRFCDERCEQLYRDYWLTEGITKQPSGKSSM